MPNGIFTLTQQARAIGQGAWVNGKTPFVNYLVVAGGGGGGNSGAGGGAGGLLQGATGIATGSAITVTVGAGGAGTSSAGSPGVSGSNSVFGSVVSNGGGGGGTFNLTPTGASGASGGSGGGAAGENDSQVKNLAGSGISGQGNAGGLSLGPIGQPYAAGGGGGAGTGGINGFHQNGPAGNGGAGIASDISGTRTAYAGGGAGGAAGSAVAPNSIGGAGGGGGTSSSYGGTAGSGTANTGGGGGGGWGGSGGAGGSGIVIISYPDTYLAPTATTGSPTVSTSGSGSISFPDAGGSGPLSGPGFIQFAGTSALAIGATGTYEFWIYPTRYAGIQHRVISQGNAANGAPDISYDASNLYVTATSGGGSATASGAPPLNTWTHVAIVLTSGTLTVYYNGVARSLSGTTTGYNMTNTSTMFVSGYSGIVGQYGVIGNLSNVRIVKGVAVYTGAFTPPAAPLQTTQPSGVNISAITGTATSLLLGSVSGSFLSDSSTNSYVASSVSTSTAAPTWNQLSPFATGLGFKNRVYTWTSSGSITF